MSKAINFIVIGAQKAGTSWLYQRLRELPDFSMPPEKQFHYFDRSTAYKSPNKLNKSKLISRIFNLKWFIYSNGRIALTLFDGRFRDALWYFKFFYGTYNDAWYLSMFKNYKGITGEVTPDYSVLTTEDIAHMYKVAPDAKIIFILRNPIDRAWSHYRYDTRKIPNFNIDQVTAEEMLKFIDSPLQEKRSDYLGTIERYTQFYPKDQILLCFFDGIKDQPFTFLEEISEFVGGDKSLVREHCKVEQRVNVSKKFSRPEHVTNTLYKKYTPIINELAAKYGQYANKWKAKLTKSAEPIDKDQRYSASVKL